GAGCVMLKGMEHGYFLSDPYFDSLYAQAQDLDLVICVHLGTSVRRLEGVPIGNLLPNPAALIDSLAPVMKGFYDVVASDLHVRFPRLRWAFLESGATWVPTVFQQHQR